MSKKKSKAPANGAESANLATAPRPHTLVIARNKHWRYISNYHGSWLQLPVEILERIAYANYYSPPPHQLDPATAFDAWKIRRDADKATELAVEAASGVSSQTPNSSNNSLHSAPAVTLSKGMKNMKRKQATTKLSQAYHLDEIAASVVTMQGATTLDDLACLVLQRDDGDLNAAYVNFFHEKIPSRQMDEYTPLTTLNSLIQHQPNDAAIYRTRALTRIFKNDLVGAAKDLTDALTVARRDQNAHKRTKSIPKGYLNSNGQFRMREWTGDKMADEEQPSSMEAHLLFHRAGIYLRMACGAINDALNSWNAQKILTARTESAADDVGFILELKTVRQAHLDFRKTVKSNARKALRDYMEFMSHLEYTPGSSANDKSEITQSLQNTKSANVMAKIESSASTVSLSSSSTEDNESSLGLPPVFKLHTLFSESPLSELPPFPSTSTELVKASVPDTKSINPAQNDYQIERASFHPLLTESLHSFLLCHALVQTSTTELRRHAMNAARIIRLLTGYPLFADARSTSRADWHEVLYQTNDWIGLSQPWTDLSRSTKRMLKEDRLRPELEPDHNPMKGHPDDQGDIPGEATDRADAIARWILEAPQTIEGAKTKKKRRPKQKVPMLDGIGALSPELTLP